MFRYYGISVALHPDESPDGEELELELLGVGVRVKKIAFVSVRVYAVALYTDKGFQPSSTAAALNEIRKG